MTQSPAAAVQEFTSMAEFAAWKNDNHDTLDSRLAREIAALPATAQPFTLPGYCAACQTNRNFRVDTGGDGDRPLDYSSINWRESLLCDDCGLNNRMRAAVDLFTEHRKDAPSGTVYMTEQVTPLYKWAKSRYPAAIGSEYLGQDKTGGLDYAGIRHEDTTRLSFGSDSFDCILSFDVLEHIPDYRRALREMARCLRPGGVLLLSAPFVSDIYATRVRARLLPDGAIEHLLPAEYHGNPTQPDAGSLCFYHFGWDLLDEIRNSGLTEACVVAYYSFERGNFGKPQLLFRASKAAPHSR
jgi:SAM-dependent methyltransferase